MGEQTSITRRQFLKSSAGVGLVLGFYLAGCKKSPSASTGAEITPEPGTFSPNVFLRIGIDNVVTITVPRSEMGQGVRTGLSMIVAEELDADWATIRVETAPASHDQQYGPQYTGGSQSVRLFWQPLREAGAAARAMLIAAAAQQWGVAPEACTTKKGWVLSPTADQELPYGELAQAASEIPLPDPANLTLKDPQDFQIIGSSLKRVDDPQFVDGSAIFGLDVAVPDMLYAVIARSPVFGGRLADFDASEADAIEGVAHIVEIDNAVAVVAENTWAAIQGRRALKVEWKEGENAALSSVSIRQDVLDQLPDGVAIDNEVAPAHSQDKLAVLYEIPYLAHVSMEPMNCVADVRSDRYEIWAPTQNPEEAQRTAQSPTGGKLARYTRRLLTGMPLESIHVHVPLMGGAFGRRLKVDYVSEAVQVSKAIEKPVQVVWTREDDIQHDFYHPNTYHHISAALSPKAEVERQDFHGPPGIPIGDWRSVTQFANAFTRESFIDELAYALEMDAVELRLQRYGNPRLKSALTLAAEKGDWGKPLPAGWGRGVAAFRTWGQTSVAEVVELSVSDEGKIKVHRVVCVVDCGIVINPDMVEAQMEGGIVFALTAALKSKVTIENGRVTQSNFHDYPILRMDEMPLIEVHIVPSSEPPTGVGEMSGPPLTPAVANAVFAATGKRVRHIPIQAEDLL